MKKEREDNVLFNECGFVLLYEVYAFQNITLQIIHFYVATSKATSSIELGRISHCLDQFL